MFYGKAVRKQIGNAVPPSMWKYLMGYIKEHLQKVDGIVLAQCVAPAQIVAPAQRVAPVVVDAIAPLGSRLNAINLDDE